MTPPNTVTLLRILLTPIFIGLLFSSDPLNKQFAFAVFTIAALTDWYDGILARRYGIISRFGKFFDPLADKILTSTAFIGFYFLGYVKLWMVVAIVFRDLLITILRMYSEYKNQQFDTSNFAKTKTALQLLIIYFILLIEVINSTTTYSNTIRAEVNSILTPFVIELSMWIATLSTVVTGIFYLVNNRKTISLLFK